jgi:hypothetical protein
LTGIFLNHNETNSYQTYDQTNSYQTYDQTNSYTTYDQTNSYQTYDQTNSYQTYDRTNSYPTYDQTNLYLYPAIYNNNIIYQQPNPVVPLYNFFGGSSSTTSGYNLADNINGRNSVDPTIMELSDDHDDQDEQSDYSNEEETGEDYTERSDFSIDEYEDEEIQRCDTTLLVTGRTERHHPVEALNNFDMFDRLGANESLLRLDDELAENKIFSSKSALNWVICDWSVRKNVQCLVQESCKTRLIMKCKEGSCPWRLYARPEEGSTIWRIITNKNSHNYRRPPRDCKHLQLTSNLIAGCVRQHLKKDLSLTVQQISMIIEIKYPDVAPTYGKL